MQFDYLASLAQQLGFLLQQAGKKITVAESCTGGLIAAAITEISGSSEWFERGFVTYSNLAKQEMLGVQAQTLACFGAVSRETALEMVNGALKASRADCAIAVTGIAGPTGGTPEKPVGTVYIAWAIAGRATYCELNHFNGSRTTIRTQTAERAMQYLLEALGNSN